MGGRSDAIHEEEPAFEGGSPPSRRFAFEDERDLQDLIISNRSALGVVNEGPLAVAEEVSVSHVGPADVVAVDREGRITIVECKRAANPDGRSAVGQLFSYAAGLWKLDYELFKGRFETAAQLGAARAEREGRSPRGVSLTEPFENDEGWNEPAFRGGVARTLTAGTFRMLIAADEIGERLQRAVTLLNALMPEVLCLALELDDAGEVLRVYGKRGDEVGPIRPRWRRPRRNLMDALPTADAARVVAGLLKWAERQGPQVGFTYDAEQRRAVVRARGVGNLFTIEGGRDIRVSFSAIAKDEQRQTELRARLSDIDRRFESGKRPIAPLETLADESKRETFLALMELNLKPSVP